MGIYNPRQTIIVTTRDKNFDNAVTLSWHSPVSWNPFMYGIFLADDRKSYEMIKNSNLFCINFLTEDMADLALFCGTHSGHDIDKFKEKKIEKEECEKINCSRIKGCSAYLECEVEQITPIGDHFMFAARVVKQVKGNNKKKLFQSNITGQYTFTTTKD